MRKILLILIFTMLLCFVAGADEYTSEFYFHVNNLRVSRNLLSLERDVDVERIANTYSDIMADNGKVDHYLLTEFEFSALCLNYDIPNATFFEVLASGPDDYIPYQIFLLFMESEPHKAALLNPSGRFIGAGYRRKNGKIFFTAYVMKNRE